MMFFAFVLPYFYPYNYYEQIRGSESLAPFEYSETEKAIMAEGGKVFPHIFGTDTLGRDIMARIMMGSRISLLVGIVASAIILVIGSIYGAVAAYFGGWVDTL